MQSSLLKPSTSMPGEAPNDLLPAPFRRQATLCAPKLLPEPFVGEGLLSGMDAKGRYRASDHLGRGHYFKPHPKFGVHRIVQGFVQPADLFKEGLAPEDRDLVDDVAVVEHVEPPIAAVIDFNVATGVGLHSIGAADQPVAILDAAGHFPNGPRHEDVVRAEPVEHFARRLTETGVDSRRLAAILGANPIG